MHVVTILGARPQFVKAGALTRHLRSTSHISEKIIHTGQHYDPMMSDIFFSELEISEPAYHLNVKAGSHGKMTGQMLEKIEEVLLQEKPDAVIVYGDTNSTLAGALAAAKLHIPVVHIEAGLRSFNMKMPEEQNRVLTDHVSQVLACPTYQSIDNLRRENITEGVYKTGDIMFDAALFAIEKVKGEGEIFERLGLQDKNYALATLHRAENTDHPDNLRKILSYLSGHGETQKIILPLHPRTRQRIQDLGLEIKDIEVIDPLGYFDFQNLLSQSNLVLTDSGGLQKEAYFHKVPCVTLRNETEWVELIDHGWNRLWSNDRYKERKPIDEYGCGKAAEEIVKILEDRFGG